MSNNASFLYDTITNNNYSECEDDFKANLSYVANFVLVVITMYSEMSGASSCEHNGFIDAIIKICRKRKAKRKMERDSIDERIENEPEPEPV